MKLQVSNLSGARAGRTIFHDVNFTLERGKALIITGKNGSGKSTLLRIICGLLEAQSGGIEVDSGEFERPGEAMHYLGHSNALKSSLSIGENLSFWRDYCGASLFSPDEALEMVKLPGIAHLPAAYLSAGQKRRVAIAKLLVAEKPIWVVDEPTAALDASSEANFSVVANEHLNRGGMLLGATHQPLAIENTITLDMDGFRP